MPNWCFNSVVFRGSPTDLAALVERVRGDHAALGFAKVIPEPPEVMESSEEGILTDRQHGWRCENWGTKWDVDVESSDAPGVTVGVSVRSLEMCFDTAWSPSLPVTDAMAKLFPALVVDHIYSDEAMALAGRAVWRGGKLVLARGYDPETPEYLAICRGRRPEESGMADWDLPWTSPTAIAAAKLDRRPSGAHHPAGVPASRLDAGEMIAGVQSMSVAVSAAALDAASSLGFPLQSWVSAGMPQPPEFAWECLSLLLSPPASPASSRLSVRPIAASPAISRRGKSPAPNPSGLVLSERSLLPSPRLLPEMGRILPSPNGFEIKLPSGWSVLAAATDQDGFAVVRKDGLAQSTPDGLPACTHWKMRRSSGVPFVWATAHCSEGKLWDPSRGIPALSEWDESGTLRRTASFFSGRFSTGSSRTSVREYGPPGPPPARPLGSAEPPRSPSPRDGMSR